MRRVIVLANRAPFSCWTREPKKVTVNTCTLDGAAALPLYQKMGFVPVGRERRIVDLAE